MTGAELQSLVQDIVQDACELKDLHTVELNAPVNYACVFSHTDQEYEQLTAAARELGTVVQETPTGPLFRFTPLDTVAGELRLLKIRRPDPTRPERGDADFTVPDYDRFKRSVLGGDGFQLIARAEMEMVELVDANFSVRAYFSHLPLDEQLGI